MADFCHRCAGELPAVGGASAFCQHCGAPQLRVSEESFVTSLSARDPSKTATEPTGKRSVQLIWAAAVGYAAVAAGISAALMLGVLWIPAAFPLAWLCTVCGEIIVLAIYQKRYPATLMNARIGARIGLVYGMLAVAALVSAIAIAGLISRFGTHTMGTVDSLLSNAMRQAAEQQALQPDAVRLSPDQIRIFYSAEVRAGLALFLLTVGAVILTLFSTLGGALGGIMRMRQR